MRILGEVASYCTMENVQDYTLTARRAGEAVYALIVISSIRPAPGDNNRHIYMVQKVQPVIPADIGTLRPLLRRLTQFAKLASSSPAKQDTAVR